MEGFEAVLVKVEPAWEGEAASARLYTEHETKKETENEETITAINTIEVKIEPWESETASASLYHHAKDQSEASARANLKHSMKHEHEEKVGLNCASGETGNSSLHTDDMVKKEPMDPELLQPKEMMHPESNSSRFNGAFKHLNIIPGDGDWSDDDIASESDNDYEPIPDSDSDFSDESSTSKVTGCKSKNDQIIWKHEKMVPYDIHKFEFKGNTDLPQMLRELETPADIFKFLFTDDLIDLIVDQSNLKALQDDMNKPANITKVEFHKFMGIIIFMSCVKLPATRNYWSNHVGQPQVYEAMSCNRFEAVKRFLHFNNNHGFIPRGAAGHDKLFKIRPALDHIRQRLLLLPKEEFLAVNEQIIPAKCGHEVKLYNAAKPHKWDYKIQVLSGVSGFIYDFDIAGVQSNLYPVDAPDLGVSSNVVTRLTYTIPRHLNYKVCFDNRFNSAELQVYLFKNGLLPLGTVRLNRVPNSNMPSEKEMKKRGCGSIEEKTAVIDDVKLSLISWFDNKTVNMLSAYVGSEPTTTKRRYVRQQKEYQDISSPQAVEVYNQHMGGVGLLDSMLGYYRIHVRSRQWYKRIFFHMVDMCMVNAWLLWRRINQETHQYVALFDFKLAVAEYFLKVNQPSTKKRNCQTGITGTPKSSCLGTPSLPTSPVSTKKCRKTPTRSQDLPLNAVRCDNVDHFPIWTKNIRQLCKKCGKYRSFTKCEKCLVYLCFNDKRNCFTDFHKI